MLLVLVLVLVLLRAGAGAATAASSGHLHFFFIRPKFRSGLEELVWQVFCSRLEFLIFLLLCVVVVKQKKLPNISLPLVLFTPVRDSKFPLTFKTSQPLSLTLNFIRSF